VAIAWPLASVCPPFSTVIVAPLLLVRSENDTVLLLTGLPAPSVTVAVMMLDSPAARELLVDDIAMLYPDAVPSSVSSNSPPQAVMKKSIAKDISSNMNVRDDFVLFDFIILLSFVLWTDDVIPLYGKILP
jgi:hypothetical protein